MALARHPSALDFRYLKGAHEKKGHEIVYRADVVGTRVTHSATEAAVAVGNASMAVPGIGLAAELIYLGFLLQHAHERPRGSKVQLALEGVELLRIVAGLATAGVLIASHFVSIPAFVATYLLRVIFGIGLFKDVFEACHKGIFRLRRHGHIYHATANFDVSSEASANVRALIERGKGAFAVKRKRLAFKTASYVVMGAGQTLLLVGTFVLPWLWIPGIALAVIGAGMRIITTVKDYRLQARQQRASKALEKLWHGDAPAILEKPGTAIEASDQDVLRSVLLTEVAGVLPWRSRRRLRRQLDAGAVPSEVAGEFLRRWLHDLGRAFDATTGDFYWDPLRAPTRYAAQLIDVLAQGETADAREVRRFLSKFLTLADFERSDGSLNREALMRKLAKNCPRGRYILEHEE